MDYFNSSKEAAPPPPSYLSPLGSGPSISPLCVQAGRVTHIVQTRYRGGDGDGNTQAERGQAFLDFVLKILKPREERGFAGLKAAKERVGFLSQFRE